MPQVPTARPVRQLPGGSAGFRPAQPPKMHGASSAVLEEDIPDLLGSITDLEMLERLFARHVTLPQIIQLMGRKVGREQILDLLQSTHLEEDLKKLLH